MQGKVEICGVNTAKLPVLKAAETRALPEKARRTPKTHCWYTVAIYNHTRSWRKLLAKLELPVCNNIAVSRVKPNLKVSVISDTDFRD